MNESVKDVKDKSFRSKRLIFSVPRIAAALLLGTVGFSLFFLYNLAYGVNSVWTGIGVGVGYFAVAAGQFILGWISDGKYTRWGRRKPYIYIFVPINALSFVFVLLPYLILPSPSELTLFIWLIVWDAIFQFSYGYATVYQAWMPEQFSTDQRPRVSQTQNVYNIIGQGIMLIFTFVVLTQVRGEIEANPSVIPPQFLITVLIFAIMLVVVFYLAARAMPTEEYHPIDSNYIQHVINIFKHKNYILVTIMQGIASFAWIIMTTVMLNYIEIVLNFGMLEYLIAAVCLLVGVIIFLTLWRKRIEKKGKKPTLLNVFLFAMIFLLLTLIGLIPMGSVFAIVFGLIFNFRDKSLIDMRWSPSLSCPERMKNLMALLICS